MTKYGLHKTYDLSTYRPKKNGIKSLNEEMILGFT
jgi:hypothetical protein